ncbi:FMN-binding protein, partial [Thioclava sp. BHET1]
LLQPNALPRKSGALSRLTTCLLAGLMAGQAPAGWANPSHHYRDGVYTGPISNALYGVVQVRARIRNGSLASVEILRAPSHRATSAFLSRKALPRLQQEAIRAQSARVDAISGATLTSHAFERSLQGALHDADS